MTAESKTEISIAVDSRTQDPPDPAGEPHVGAADPDPDGPATALTPLNHPGGAGGPIAGASSAGTPTTRGTSRSRRTGEAAIGDIALGVLGAASASVAIASEAAPQLPAGGANVHSGAIGRPTNPDLQTARTGAWPRREEALAATSAQQADGRGDDPQAVGQDAATKSVADPDRPADGRGAPTQPENSLDADAAPQTGAPSAQLETAGGNSLAVDTTEVSAPQSQSAPRPGSGTGRSPFDRQIPTQRLTAAAPSLDFRSPSPGYLRDPSPISLGVSRGSLGGEGWGLAPSLGKPGFGAVSRDLGGNASDNLTAAAEGLVGPSAATAAPAGLLVETVSDPSRAKLSSANFPDQLSGHVIGSIENSARDVVLHLHPPELGDLTVRVVVSGREVSAWFATPQEQVQQMIRQAIGQLHTDLGNAGYNLAGAWVGADASGSRERNARLAPTPTDRIAARGADAVDPANTSAPSPSSGVSIYV
ncbi:MAG: flagellar hook-length control protein FliK [Alphaproteobacteria bacterium]|nr:flagellar hook-length control protein FliK [Alphaproteobacteria bacterium]